MEPVQALQKEASLENDTESQDHHHGHSFEDSAATQVIGVAILEFGVLLHR